MSNKDGYSRKGFFGQINHYDDRGHKTGHSTKGFWNDWNHYED